MDDQREQQVLMTGIGGQGIQLASQVLARAAILAGLDVQLFGSYEGMMRGGATEATLVVSGENVQAPPTIHEASAAILMHHEHAGGAVVRVRPGGLLLVNSSVVEDPVVLPDCTVLAIAATDTAVRVGHAMTASMVAVGAYAALTGLVGSALLEEAVGQSLPPYRRAHIPLNVAALAAGFALAGDVATARGHQTPVSLRR
ncbi:MAG: 2-oxoacid:acceptor oxidoreductase family protein [Acidimicrobiales bacterium]